MFSLFVVVRWSLCVINGCALLLFTNSQRILRFARSRVKYKFKVTDGQRGGGRHFADSPININACQPSTPRHLRPCQSASTAAFLLRQGGADDRADDQTFGTRTAAATEDADADADEEGTRTADAHFARGILFSRPVLVLLKRAFWQGAT